MEGDELGKQLEHAEGVRGQLARVPVERAQGPEHRAIGQQDGERDVAGEAVHGGCWVTAENRVGLDVGNHDRFARVPDLVADGRLDLELAAGGEPEADLVAHAAGDPAVLGDPGDRGKAHGGGAAHHLQDGRDGLDAGDELHRFRLFVHLRQTRRITTRIVRRLIAVPMVVQVATR